MIQDSSKKTYTEVTASTDNFWYSGSLNIIPSDAYISYAFNMYVYTDNKELKNPNISIGRVSITSNSNKKTTLYIEADYDNYEKIYDDVKNILTELRNNYPEYRI